MAAPNLKTPTIITGKTARYQCTTTLASALSNASNSGKVLKVVAIRAANILGSASASVDVSHYRSSTHTYLTKSAVIPAGSSLIVLSREEYEYLEEGDAIYAASADASSVDLLITYEDVS